MDNKPQAAPRPASVLFEREESGCCQALLDALPFYVLLVDEEHHIVAANRAVIRDLDEQPEHICGEYCPRAIHHTDEPYPGCPLEEAVAAGTEVEKVLYDEEEGKWMQSAVYPTRLCDARGRPLYIHFARDVTPEKLADVELAQSLEHHKAVGRILERLQRCRRPEEVLEQLIDVTMDLSWMSVANAAAGFLFQDGWLRMVASRNLDPGIRRRCATLNGGDCICGLVAESGRAAVATGAEVKRVLDQEDQPVVHHGHATLPLIYEDRTLGVLNFYLEEGGDLDDSQLEFLEAAVGVASAALAEQNAREEARKFREEKLQIERRLLGRVLNSQEDERKRVARELHDDLGQALSALLLEIRAEDAKTAASYGEFQKRMERSIRQLIEKVSMLAWELRPSILDDYGLQSAIARYAQRLDELTELDIDYQFLGPKDGRERLSSEVEVVLYRIAQESLNNVVRHAHASRVSVLLVHQQESMTLLVEDDGEGFEPQEVMRAGDEQCLGLMGMQERAALVQGELLIESAPGKGTTVKVTVPNVRQMDDDSNPDRG